MGQYTDLYQNKKNAPIFMGPHHETVNSFLNEALDIIYPGMTRKLYPNEIEFKNSMDQHLKNLTSILALFNFQNIDIEAISKEYKSSIGLIANLVYNDGNALLEGDPAATSIGEVVLSYPGLYAIASYRVGHFFYKLKIPTFPRMLTEAAHNKTGIDIHPGAHIGESFFIDHGTGVVIGETCLIGSRVKVYQGVTLGALSVEKTLANTKRHPTIEDDCIIYAHATILGGETIVGSGSVIGGNVWLTRSVPKNSIVYHRSEVKLDKKAGFNQEEEISYEI